MCSKTNIALSPVILTVFKGLTVKKAHDRLDFARLVDN